MQETSWLAEDLLGTQEGLSCMELVSQSVSCALITDDLGYHNKQFRDSSIMKLRYIPR
jgi:hypothetical protein